MLDFSFVCGIIQNKSFHPESWFLMYEVGTIKQAWRVVNAFVAFVPRHFDLFIVLPWILEGRNIVGLDIVGLEHKINKMKMETVCKMNNNERGK